MCLIWLLWQSLSTLFFFSPSFVDLALFDVIKRVFLGKEFDFFMLKGFLRIFFFFLKLSFKASVFLDVMYYLRFKMKTLISLILKKEWRSRSFLDLNFYFFHTAWTNCFLCAHKGLFLYLIFIHVIILS